MSGVNKVILLGNLGSDPEIKTLESGTKLARLSLATSENYKDRNGEKRTNTEWHSITLWRGLAEIAERYLNKGDQIYLEGRIRSRKYTDKEGVERTYFEIVGDNMTMLGSRKGGGDNSGQPQQGQQGQAAPQQQPQAASTASESINEAQNDDSDDLPF